MLPEKRILEAALLEGFSSEEAEHFLQCTGASLIRMDRGSFLDAGNSRCPLFGVLLSGSLAVTRYDAFGNRFLLQTVEPGEVFGLNALPASEDDRELSLLICSPSELLMLDAARVLHGCSQGCAIHRKLYLNLMKLLAAENLGLNRRQYHMAQRTLRRKLSSFLSEQSGLARARRFSVRMDRQELADYLGVDRSALCAELSRMKKEGLIDYYRHDFYIKSSLLEESMEF